MMHRFLFVLKRPYQMLPVLLGISIVSFILVRMLPGDPARMLLGAKATPEAIAAIRERYGLDGPLIGQYWEFITHLLQGEFGQSIVYRSPVLPVIAARVMPSVSLLLYAIALSVAMAVPLAAIAARNRGRWPDHLVRAFLTLGIGMPAFWIGIILMSLFSVRLGWFPVSGYGSTFAERLHHLFLPAFTIAIVMSPVLTRSLRASLLSEAAADYVTAARARGLPEGHIYRTHVLRNALIPAVNLLGVNIGWLIGGSVIVETVFSVPGIGQLMTSSIFSRDYMVVQAIAMGVACVTIVVNLLVDIAISLLDPRVEQ